MLLTNRFLEDFFAKHGCDWQKLNLLWRSAGLEICDEVSLKMLADAALARAQTRQDIHSLVLLCYCQRYLGQTRHALQLAEANRHLEHPELLTCQAILLCDLNRWQEAEPILERALQLGPTDASRQVRFRMLAHRAATGRRN